MPESESEATARRKRDYALVLVGTRAQQVNLLLLESLAMEWGLPNLVILLCTAEVVDESRRLADIIREHPGSIGVDGPRVELEAESVEASFVAFVGVLEEVTLALPCVVAASGGTKAMAAAATLAFAQPRDTRHPVTLAFADPWKGSVTLFDLDDEAAVERTLQHQPTIPLTSLTRLSAVVRDPRRGRGVRDLTAFTPERFELAHDAWQHVARWYDLTWHGATPSLFGAATPDAARDAWVNVVGPILAARLPWGLARNDLVTALVRSLVADHEPRGSSANTTGWLARRIASHAPESTAAAQVEVVAADIVARFIDVAPHKLSLTDRLVARLLAAARDGASALLASPIEPPARYVVRPLAAAPDFVEPSIEALRDVWGELVASVAPSENNRRVSTLFEYVGLHLVVGLLRPEIEEGRVDVAFGYVLDEQEIDILLVGPRACAVFIECKSLSDTGGEGEAGTIAAKQHNAQANILRRLAGSPRPVHYFTPPTIGARAETLLEAMGTQRARRLPLHVDDGLSKTRELLLAALKLGD